MRILYEPTGEIFDNFYKKPKVKNDKIVGYLYIGINKDGNEIALENDSIQFLYKLPCEIGATVWVSPNNGKSFHTGTFLGIKANENNLKHIAYMVQVNDIEKSYVDSPMSKVFIDYFSKVYTKAEIEQLKSTLAQH